MVIEMGGDRHDGRHDLLSSKLLRIFFQVAKKNGRQVFGLVQFLFAHVFNLNENIVIFVALNLIGQILNVFLDIWVTNLPTDKSFEVGDGIFSKGLHSNELFIALKCNN